MYKWVGRYNSDDANWSREVPKRPHKSPHRINEEIEEYVKMVRLHLYNRDLFCGAQAILWELEEQGIYPLPSVRTISRILSRSDLTHKRTGRYEPKGLPYPELMTSLPNQRQQADFVGPRHLRGIEGSIRFYSLNIVDLATGRCGVQAMSDRSGNSLYEALWSIWSRLGMPQHFQVDNEAVFYGGPKYPRGMGPLIRLCLNHGIELWFTPPSEPWRNGVVEKFNNHYQQKFLQKIPMETEDELKKESLIFEHKHNSCYRYSKLKGKTPLQALRRFGAGQLCFPDTKVPIPKCPLGKPVTGKYHLIRFIRGNGKLNVFGELFSLAPELHHEYVTATIDVKEQKLKVIHNKKQVDDFEYKLR